MSNFRRLSRAIIAALAMGLAGCSVPVSPGFSGPARSDTPDRHGEVWGGDTHPDGRPTAQVILTHRQRNTDGSAPGGWDGLCVLASITNALHTQGYHEEANLIWAEGKRRPGGYGPDKLDRLLRELTPHLKYVSIVGTSTEPLERLLRAGVPVSGTLRTAKLYNGMPIHHMVNPVHLDGRTSAWVDNNAPDRVSWGPRSLYDQRYLDGGTGWAVAFAPKYAAAGIAGLVAAGVVLGLYFILTGVFIREAVA